MRRSQEAPNLGQMPVYDRMYTHERRPIVVGRVEVREMCAVGICAAGPDEDGSHGRV